MIFSKLSIKKSISSFVFLYPNVVLKDPSIYSFGVFIASSTCDGSVLPELQAEPVDAHIPNLI